jgi:hypothetical protein
MKIAVNPLLFILLVLFSGCSEAQRPVASGNTMAGEVWEHAPLRVGAPIPQGSRVDVYDNLIIIHLNDGSRRVVPLDQVSGLKLK